ncbi:GNAT family N-acetyltransferase [Halomicrobium salinisoli]|uniref:GNAT family N-acetyltransferase n=1 Tax=Halomicrobium salinisoli TaxID=2878391 RepID=UPI001CF06AAE|nr:GNAT family N-acetyltransferase [Halomicrobium salinisoli]
MSETGVERVDEESLTPVLALRRAVFVEEQGVPEDRERDGRDDEAVHFLARVDGDPVGTARLRRAGGATGKVERVAVLPAHRGDGWGRRLMTAVEDEARRRGLDRLRLHAQTSVEGFYRALDYETTSDVFEEAGIPHVEMEKRLD